MHDIKPYLKEYSTNLAVHTYNIVGLMMDSL